MSGTERDLPPVFPGIAAEPEPAPARRSDPDRWRRPRPRVWATCAFLTAVFVLVWLQSDAPTALAVTAALTVLVAAVAALLTLADFGERLDVHDCELRDTAARLDRVEAQQTADRIAHLDLSSTVRNQRLDSDEVARRRAQHNGHPLVRAAPVQHTDTTTMKEQP